MRYWPLAFVLSCVFACGDKPAARETGDMVEIPGDGTVEPFAIDAHEVTNREFAAFVEATGYVTDAERIGNSVVFDVEAPELHVVLEGAHWRAPAGPGTNLDGMADHPVVHVSWNDATAYAAWRGCRLPTKAEWTVAARGGLDAPIYPWGDELRPGGEHRMNAWQGAFPVEDRALDGFTRTSPVASFPPNGYGLFDMAGNVWEWTADRFGGESSGAPVFAEATGGSFRCRERAVPGHRACRGYRIGSSQTKLLDDGNDNVGFRCARDLPSD